MGKGGQKQVSKQDAKPSSLASSVAATTNESVWKSPYNPLDKNAPALPTKGQIRAVIPPECFERSYVKSMFYLFRDALMAAAFAYVTSQVLSTEVPAVDVSSVSGVLPLLTWGLGWMTYAFWMGTILTGPWVLAHECGHGAFSPSQTFNDIVGFVVHQALLVPYFAWQYTHAKHHRRTNHLQDGESHVPSTAKDNGLGEHLERHSFYAAWHEAMGDGAFAVFQIWTHLCLGWPLYLLGLASTGKWKYDGTPLNGAIADHFRPNSPMFLPKVRGKILLSTVTEIASLIGLFYLGHTVGHLKVVLWYWLPYTVVNAWLVLYTWLQHTDPSVPHYGEGDWTWVRGALSTIDRPYGIFDFFHHTIGSTHVVHHLFHEMPWYNAEKATAAVKEYLEPMGLYNYDPTYWVLAMWRIAHTCHYVDDDTGIQYFKSLEDVPRTHAAPRSKKA
jgi:omega-6 fatty acid desaturase / acyl-lipid omega-6 desaturase (Delta-12 desaturase)